MKLFRVSTYILFLAAYCVQPSVFNLEVISLESTLKASSNKKKKAKKSKKSNDVDAHLNLIERNTPYQLQPEVDTFLQSHFGKHPLLYSLQSLFLSEFQSGNQYFKVFYPHFLFRGSSREGLLLIFNTYPAGYYSEDGHEEQYGSIAEMMDHWARLYQQSYGAENDKNFLKMYKDNKKSFVKKVLLHLALIHQQKLGNDIQAAPFNLIENSEVSVKLFQDIIDSFGTVESFNQQYRSFARRLGNVKKIPVRVRGSIESRNTYLGSTFGDIDLQRVAKGKSYIPIYGNQVISKKEFFDFFRGDINLFNRHREKLWVSKGGAFRTLRQRSLGDHNLELSQQIIADSAVDAILSSDQSNSPLAAIMNTGSGADGLLQLNLQSNEKFLEPFHGVDDFVAAVNRKLPIDSQIKLGKGAQNFRQELSLQVIGLYLQEAGDVEQIMNLGIQKIIDLGFNNRQQLLASLGLRFQIDR